MPSSMLVGCSHSDGREGLCPSGFVLRRVVCERCPLLKNASAVQKTAVPRPALCWASMLDPSCDPADDIRVARLGDEA